MIWVKVRDTMLADEVDVRTAGKLFSAAGFKKKKVWSRSETGPTTTAYVESKAEHLTKAEIEGMITAPKTKKPDTGPSYTELVDTVEAQDRLIHELRDEIRQLRQFQQPSNGGLSDRARKALAAARQTLSLYPY